MEAVQVPAEIRQGRGQLAATIVLGHMVKHLYNAGMRSLIMPEVKIGLGLSRAQFGSLATAQSATNAMFTILAGYLGDRFNHRAGLMLGLSLGLMGVAQTFAGFAPGYWTMFAAMLFVGVGPALFHPPAISTLSRRFPDRRGFAVSLHGMGANVGEVLGPVIVAGALSLLMWRDVLKVGAVPAVLAAFVIWIMIRPLPGDEKSGVGSLREYFATAAELLANRVLLVLVLATALRSIGESAVGAYLPLYLRDDLAIEALPRALLLSGAYVAGVVSQPVMGYLSDRFGRKAVMLPATAALSLLAFALSVAEPGPQLVAVVVAKGAFTFSLHHIFIAAALDSTRGKLQSTVVSLIYAAGFLGTFSPYVAGLISDEFGIHSAFIYGGSVLVLPVVLLALVRIPRVEATAD